MKHLLNTLFILTNDAYASVSGENVKITFADKTSKLVPLHTLEQILCFSYKGASTSLIRKCVENGILISFYSPSGRHQFSVADAVGGNVLLRREQFRIADDDRSLDYGRNFLLGKIYNARNVLLRYARQYPLRIDSQKLRSTAETLTQVMSDISDAKTVDSLRGFEGTAASEYFSVFGELILQNQDMFLFSGRNRRPPMDRVNALLSFSYSILANDCESALRSVGLDPYVGFIHTDRPGRKSLALDMEEELRAPFADRFVLSLINERIVNEKDFTVEDNGAVLLNDSGRRKFFAEWQKKKNQEFTHPFLKEKIQWGLVPYVQALLLNRTIREDLDAYPPFFYK